MKTNLILLFMLLVNTVFAQHQNSNELPHLNKLPQKERDSILVKIANEAIKKYSIGYLRPGNKPYIEDMGIEQFSERKREDYKRWGLEQYFNRYRYAVYYLPTKEEQKFYKREYLVKVIVLADSRKVYSMRYIDDVSWVGGMDDSSPEEDKQRMMTKRKFKTVEERLVEIERFKNPKVDTVLPPDMAEKRRKYLEMRQRLRDSLHVLRLQYLRRRDSIRQQDSIRIIRQQDSIRNAQTENK